MKKISISVADQFGQSSDGLRIFDMQKRPDIDHGDAQFAPLVIEVGVCNDKNETIDLRQIIITIRNNKVVIV